MIYLGDYRKRQDRLSDLLPWAMLVAPGIVLNKDGSLQRSVRFRGPDLSSSSAAEMVGVMGRINNALRRLGSGWAVYFEAQRREQRSYPEANHFPDRASWLVDLERRQLFVSENTNFESHYYLTLQYLPPTERYSFFERLLLRDGPAKNGVHGTAKILEHFTDRTERIVDILADVMSEVRVLGDDETLTYPHSTVSTKNHALSAPEVPAYLDALNHLPMSYRWMTRFLPMDNQDAESTIKEYRRRWFAKRKGISHLIRETMTKSESALQDSTALRHAEDAEEALAELTNDYVTYGYLTATFTVLAKTSDAAEERLREAERVVNGFGFTCVVESFNAVEAWLSSLPGQVYANVRKPLVNSLNLAHVAPLCAAWSGPEQDPRLNAPAWLYTKSAGNTTFRIAVNEGDVGHKLVIGPTGSGKSVLLALMALQFRRYRDAQVFIFDKGASALAATAAAEGSFVELCGEKGNLCFQPLARADSPPERTWLFDWISGLCDVADVPLIPQRKQAVWDALVGIAALPPPQRTLTGLQTLVQDREIRRVLEIYTEAGPIGRLLDAQEESISDKHWNCFEMEKLMEMPRMVGPVLSYLFHRIEDRFDGRPTLLILDEAWLFLDSPIFRGRIKNWLKTLRKANVAVVCAMQTVEDTLNSGIAASLLESCPARIFLPNARALEPSTMTAYQSLGLNERQIEIVAGAAPKSEYYFQSPSGCRLFELNMGPVQMAFCGTSRAEDREAMWGIIRDYGWEQFVPRYLEQRGIGELAAVLN